MSKVRVSEKIKLGISSCLLGAKVRYDGGHKLDHFLANTMGKLVEWVPVCPEVESGLSVPREAMRLIGSPDSLRLVTVNTGLDLTSLLATWTKGRLSELGNAGLCGFVFKSRSPSSGIRDVKIYAKAGGSPRKGAGIFGGAFIDKFPLLPVENNERLGNPVLRENFIERAFVFRRWRDLLEGGLTVRRLAGFHSDHELLLLAHSPVHCRSLELILAQAGKLPLKKLSQTYIATLMEGLRYASTPAKNTKVIHRAIRCLGNKLPAKEREELLQITADYRKRLVPLTAPQVLLGHYARIFDIPYLKKQHYLNPDPQEVMLRNHA